MNEDYFNANDDDNNKFEVKAKRKTRDKIEIDVLYTDMWTHEVGATFTIGFTLLNQLPVINFKFNADIKGYIVINNKLNYFSDDYSYLDYSFISDNLPSMYQRILEDFFEFSFEPAFVEYFKNIKYDKINSITITWDDDQIFYKEILQRKMYDNYSKKRKEEFEEDAKRENAPILLRTKTIPDNLNYNRLLDLLRSQYRPENPIQLRDNLGWLQFNTSIGRNNDIYFKITNSNYNNSLNYENPELTFSFHSKKSRDIPNKIHVKDNRGFYVYININIVDGQIQFELINKSHKNQRYDYLINLFLKELGDFINQPKNLSQIISYQLKYLKYKNKYLKLKKKLSL